MTIFGIPDAAALVARVALGEPSETECRELFARAAWSSLAEPGDRAAVVAIDALGAAPALEALIAKWPAPRIHAAIGDPSLSINDVSQAMERWMPRLEPAPILQSLRGAARVSARLVIPTHDLWPGSLDDLGEHRPVALWFRGNGAALQSLSRSIALVGARAATSYGEHVTMEASAGLVDRGFAIVSGAAYGIDGMAHRAALASEGTTVAFLAGGVDRFYPSGHDALLSRIAATGAVVTELPPGFAPTKWRFLQRNRLISAASQATVVVEAGRRSGSLNTASHALQLGRPLGAVPGPVTSAASAGCHKLLRNAQAVCVTDPDEMAELATLEAAQAEQPRGAFTDDATRVLDAMSFQSARSAENIAERAGMSVRAVCAHLGHLGLDRAVAERPTGWVRVRK